MYVDCHSAATEDRVLSPLTGSDDVHLVGRFDVRNLRGKWRERLGIDIGDEFPCDGDISLYCCGGSGLRFFRPSVLEGSSTLYESLQSIEWYYSGERWDFQCALADLSSGGEVLEVGCGTGQFLSLLMHPDCRTTGIDINPRAVNEARNRGINAIESPLADFAGRNEGRFDVVCSFQVLEHLADPHTFIQMCLALTKPGGTLIFSTPNSDGYLKFDDEILDLPPHHMSRWNSGSFRFLEKIFPMKLERMRLQPLALGELGRYCRAKQVGWGMQRGLLAHRKLNTVSRVVLYYVLRTGLYRLCAGHSMYVKFRKKGSQRRALEPGCQS
jgi:SAM-dependent methyltransferase